MDAFDIVLALMLLGTWAMLTIGGFHALTEYIDYKRDCLELAKSAYEQRYEEYKEFFELTSGIIKSDWDYPDHPWIPGAAIGPVVEMMNAIDKSLEGSNEG